MFPNLTNVDLPELKILTPHIHVGVPLEVVATNLKALCMEIH